MARYVLLSDIHATERPPSSCTDAYLDDLLDLLAQTMSVALTIKAAGVVWAGDIFHHKAPSRSSHRLVLAMIKVIQSAPCPVWIVPGNHDIQNDRLESLEVTQPLGVLLKAGARLLDGWAYELAGEVLPLYGVPWQQRWEDEPVRDALAGYRKSPGCLVVTHAPLYPPGLELKYEHYPASSFADAMGNDGSVFYGHVHEAHGVYSTSGVQFCNNGALSRGSIHEHNLTREVSCTVWDSTTGEFERVPLKARPAVEVFRLQEKAEVTDMQGRLDEFLASVGSASLEVVSVESVMAHVRTLGLEAPVLELVEELVEEASHDCG